MTLPRTVPAAADAAHLRARVGGYVVDMVIFSAIAMLVSFISGFILLATTHWAKKDATDPQFYTFLAIIGLGTPLVWTLLNLGLLARRGQTGGQYVAGIRLRRDDGGAPSFATGVAWWFSGNPLLFSWPMAAVAGLPLSSVFFLVLGKYELFLALLVVALCLLAPLVALVSALFDSQNRALHDRVAGVVAVPND